MEAEERANPSIPRTTRCELRVRRPMPMMDMKSTSTSLERARDASSQRVSKENVCAKSHISFHSTAERAGSDPNNLMVD